jgi:hypothetical protein
MTYGGEPRRREQRRLILGILLFGLLVSAFFGFGAVRSAVRIAAAGLDSGAAHADQVRGWMTVPYIARVFDLPAEELYSRIGVPAEGSETKSLQRLNRKYYPDRRG